jgi:hypothetical protein
MGPFCAKSLTHCNISADWLKGQIKNFALLARNEASSHRNTDLD